MNSDNLQLPLPRQPLLQLLKKIMKYNLLINLKKMPKMCLTRPNCPSLSKRRKAAVPFFKPIRILTTKKLPIIVIFRAATLLT